jgi:hypothetical protein
MRKQLATTNEPQGATFLTRNGMVRSD